MTAPWYRQKNITEIAASLRTALGFGTAADRDVEDFATPGDLSALESSVNDAISNKVSTSRVIGTGSGLNGGGDLSDNLTISADIADSSAISEGTPNKLVDAAGLKTVTDNFGAIASSGDIKIVTFTSSGSYVPSAKLKWAEITVIGGGGGWGNYQSSNVSGAGGGAAIKKVKAADLAASNAVVVGAGGALNTNGGNSSITLPGGTITGGGGGSGYSAGYYSTGGVGTGGQWNLQGSGGVQNGAAGASPFDPTSLPPAQWRYGHGGTSSNAAKAGVVIIEEHF